MRNVMVVPHVRLYEVKGWLWGRARWCILLSCVMSASLTVMECYAVSW